MKIRVKLFGTFRLNFSDYDEHNGIVLEMPDGGRVNDLLPRLGISGDHGAIAWIGFKLIGMDYMLSDNDEVKIMQLALGG